MRFEFLVVEYGDSVAGFNPATVRFEFGGPAPQDDLVSFNPATVRFECKWPPALQALYRFNPATVRFEFRGVSHVCMLRGVSIPQRCDLNGRRIAVLRAPDCFNPATVRFELKATRKAQLALTFQSRNGAI